MEALAGSSSPLGAHLTSGGVNFALYAPRATRLALLLFRDGVNPRPYASLRLDPERHRSGPYWHARVAGLGAGTVYGYRAWGPGSCDPEKVLLDPYTRCALLDRYDRDAARLPGDNVGCCARGVVVDRRGYDWEGDAPLRRREPPRLLYELHVGGFTRSPSSGLAPELRGTYAGLVTKIPYLVELGVSAVQLMPVFQFDAQDAPNGRQNYWGYSPLAWFAPHRAYSARKDPLGPVDEFRDMVKALHRAGIEVILDVVFNHTCEAGQDGPTLSLRGLADEVYYLRDRGGRYANYSGCGNTVNANHPVVRRLILDCLRYWVQEMHVDGFRFDLAAALTRGADGEPLAHPPLIEDISSDPVLADSRLIAEPWDAAGLYQLGRFGDERWYELNDRFRDDLRRFVAGHEQSVAPLAGRLTGSPELYAASGRTVHASVNGVTSHDGFTLADLVAFNKKHNLANGEHNRDGHNANHSWNCGVEGPTEDPAVRTLRARQVRNFATLVAFSQGTPFWLMGDELGRSQRGNNNAYCQDNPLSWLDWTGLEREAGLLAFVRGLFALRRRFRLFRLTEPWSGHRRADALLTWHGVRPEAPDWGPRSHSLAWSLAAGDEHLYVACNAWWEPLRFALPAPPRGQSWRRLVATFPGEVRAPGLATPVPTPVLTLAERSCAVLAALPGGGEASGGSADAL